MINRERGEHTWRIGDVEILPDVATALVTAGQLGMVSIVISNQSGIGLGLYTHGDVELVHRYIHDRLAPAGARIDAVYYCPHHPEHGRCLCRKPAGLLFERAIARFDIDPIRSIMVGDKERDLQAAAAAGVRAIRMEANSSLLLELRQQDIIAWPHS